MMKSIIFESIWEQALLDGEKVVFVSKANKYTHLEELDVNIDKAGVIKHIGFTKIRRIKVYTGKDLEEITISHMNVFRTWLSFAHKYGIKDVYRLIEEIYRKLNPKRYEEFNVIQFEPIKDKSYNSGAKNGH